MHETWVEIWTRPGDPTFEPIAADPDASNWSATVRLNGVGEGVLQVPDDWRYFDEVFYQDPDDPSQSRRSLVRLYSSEQEDVPFYEWIIDASTPPESQELAWQIDGPGIEAIVGEVILEPWDWDGSDQFQSYFPDHAYGGENLVGDLKGRYAPGIFRIVDNGNTDGGTFTITVNNSGGGSPSTTGNIPYDANPTQVYNELIALGTIDELEVSGDPGDIRIQITKPELTHTLTTNSFGLSSVRWLSIEGTVTGGTFTLTIDGDTTNPIAYNATAATIKTEIELLPSVTECETSGALSGFVRIGFITPDIVSTFTADFSGLTDGSGNLYVPGAFYEAETEQAGDIRPVGWTSSEFSPTDIQHGTLDEFRMWMTGDPALVAGATTAIMFDGTEPYYPGIQTILDVSPGTILQAGMWVYSATTTSFRMVIRDLADKLIQPDAYDEQTVTAGVWTFFSLTDVAVPLDIDEIIFRIGHVGTGDPGQTFVALPYVREGLPAATVGAIWADVYDDATIDHPTRSASGQGAWWDGTRRYLEYDFDAVNDSNGNPWPGTINLTLKRGQNYLKILSKFAELGYEWRVVPKQLLTAVPSDDGVWVLRIFNPGTAGTDRTADLMPLIHEYQRSGTRQFGPSATRFTIEADSEISARAIDAAADAAIGHIERYESDRDLNTIDEADDYASFLLAQSIDRTQSLNPVISPQPGDLQPLVGYTVGDSVNVQTRSLNDAVEVTTQGRRIVSITTATSPIEGTTYQLALGSESFVGVGSFYEGVRVLLDEFRALRDNRPAVSNRERKALEVTGSGGAGWTVRVAASDALPAEKAVADFVCNGINDEVVITAAFDAVRESTRKGGMIWFSTGTFLVDMTNGGVTLAGDQGPVVVQGSGKGVTIFRLTGEPPGNNYYLFDCYDPYYTFQDFTVTDWTNLSSYAPNGLRIMSNTTIRNVYFDYVGGDCIVVNGGSCLIENCYIYGGFGLSSDTYESTHGIYVNFGANLQVRHNYITTLGRGITTRESYQVFIEDNIFACEGHQIYFDGPLPSSYGAHSVIKDNWFFSGKSAIRRSTTANDGPDDTGNANGYLNGMKITGNTFNGNSDNIVTFALQNSDLPAATGAIDLANVSSLVIDHNYFYQNHMNDIILRRSADYPLNPQGTDIGNNIFQAQNADDTFSSILVLGLDPGNYGGINVHDNQWYISGERWIIEFQHLDTAYYFTNCRITNNFAKIDGASGIYVHKMVNSTIEGNQLNSQNFTGGAGPVDRTNTELYGLIELDACEEMIVRGNLGTSAVTFSTPASASLVELINACDDILVEHNVYKEDISEGSGAPLDVGLTVESGCTDIRAVGNDFRDATARFVDPGAVLVLTYTGGAGIGDNW